MAEICTKPGELRETEHPLVQALKAEMNEIFRKTQNLM